MNMPLNSNWNLSPPLDPNMAQTAFGGMNFAAPQATLAQSLAGLGSTVDPTIANANMNWFQRGMDWTNKNAAGLGSLAQGLGALSGMYFGSRQLGLAREQLGFQKEAFNTNMRNSIQSYNTSLEDRIRGRSSDYEGKENDVRAYLDRHSLRRGG